MKLLRAKQTSGILPPDETDRLAWLEDRLGEAEEVERIHIDDRVASGPKSTTSNDHYATEISETVLSEAERFIPEKAWEKDVLRDHHSSYEAQDPRTGQATIKQEGLSPFAIELTSDLVETDQPKAEQPEKAKNILDETGLVPDQTESNPYAMNIDPDLASSLEEYKPDEPEEEAGQKSYQAKQEKGSDLLQAVELASRTVDSEKSEDVLSIGELTTHSLEDPPQEEASDYDVMRAAMQYAKDHEQDDTAQPESAAQDEVLPDATDQAVLILDGPAQKQPAPEQAVLIPESTAPSKEEKAKEGGALIPGIVNTKAPADSQATDNYWGLADEMAFSANTPTENITADLPCMQESDFFTDPSILSEQAAMPSDPLPSQVPTSPDDGPVLLENPVPQKADPSPSEPEPKKPLPALNIEAVLIKANHAGAASQDNTKPEGLEQRTPKVQPEQQSTPHHAPLATATVRKAPIKASKPSVIVAQQVPQTKTEPPQEALDPHKKPNDLSGPRRAAVHFKEGASRRGVIKEISTNEDTIHLYPQGSIDHPGDDLVALALKAIFLMLPPGTNYPPKKGLSCKIVLIDNRSLEGFTPDYDPNHKAFTLFPTQNRGNIERVMVFNEAVKNIWFSES
jgi:hypothetical protein